MTRPRLRLGSHLAPGVLALVLFGILASVIVRAPFGTPEGFGEGSVTESIGFALLNLDGSIPSEGFLVALILIALVLDAALDGAVHLARREDDGVASGGDNQ